MKKVLLTLLLFSFFNVESFSQNTWIQKANFSGTSRAGSVGFSIGSKGYCGTGNDGINGPRNDFWEYNPANNTWTQKANFGGAPRADAIGFSIGTKGYIGTGGNLNDFWEYNPSNNSWTQKAPYGGPGCKGAVGFTIGSKGYIGTGGFANNTFSDFWEYNPITDVWLQKVSIGGSARIGASGFAIGNKGYIGLGVIGVTPLIDFWEYDPSIDSWTQKANFPSNFRFGASGFCIGTKGYICGGDGIPSTRYNDLWEYNPVTDSWLQRINYPGMPFGFAASFSIGNKGYVGIGSIVTGLTNEFYEYTPIPSLITEIITGSPFCAGNSLSIIYTTTTTYISGNTFAAQLSNASGSFANPVTIGVITATNSGTIPCVIPANTPAGSAYRIRVVSSLPVDIGTNNGVDLVICSVTWPVSLAPVCYNGSPVALSGGMPAGGFYSGPGVDAFGNFVPTQVIPGVYTLSYSFNSALGCLCSVNNTITVLGPPAVTWPVSFAPLCGTENPFALTGGLPSGGTYSGPGVDASGIFHPGLVPFGTVTLTYTYTDGFGCTNTTTNTINIINCIDCGICYTPGSNLIVNGNFSNGNNNFFSALTVSCTCLVGSYCVTTDAFLKCSSFLHINDHTSGTGNFLVIDGSESSNVVVWQQNVAVAGSTTYTFSFWVHPQVSFINSNPILNIIIDNVSQGIINTALLPKQWNKLVFSWTSASPANIPITIRQTNGAFSGMDYGLDDISFNACIPNVVANGGPDRTICSGDTVHLNSSNNLFTNNWYEINTGNPANYPFVGSGDIVVSPTSNKCYLLRVCSGECCDSDSVCIVVNPKPIVTWPISYSDVCTNHAPVHLVEGMPAGGVYSGPGISGNYFDPALAALGNNIIYYKYTNSFGCSDSISNTIKVVHCVECGPCFIEGPDLVVNGDFENGNIGFSSTLSFAQSCTLSSYAIVNTANQKCILFYTIPDHTTGSGKYMVNDGDFFQPKDIWTENVNVTIGNTYKFSFWMHPILSNGISRADIDMMINGSVKMSIVGTTVPNQWTNYVVSWVANVNGTIPITLHQSNTGSNGCDYGFDDIVFKECISILEVTWPIVFVDVCIEHQPFLLTGGMPSGGTYSGQGVSNNIFNPSTVLPGTYILTYTYTDNNGCTNFTTNTITVLSPPVVTWPISFSPLCGIENPFALTGGLPAGGIYSGPGVDASGFFHPGLVPFGTTTITYTYSDSHGCLGSATNTITLSKCSTCGECSTAGQELVINGDFSNGNTGFSSTLPVSCTCLVGSYCVTTNSFLKCNNFDHVSDHTSGNGNFLVVDGSQTSNKIIWEQNISVVAGTTYHFSFWLHPAVSDGLFKANLNININNVTQNSLSMLNMSVQWNQQVITWVSNLTGSVPVTILQTNSGSYGYDYGIDDISFNACIPNVVANGGPDRTICSGDTMHLNSSNNLFTNNWYEVNTGNPANYPFVGSGNIVVSPTSNKCYLLRVCSGECCDSDSVCIVVNPKPIVTWPISYSDVCTNHAPVHLVEGLPAGGVYSGPGISGNYFDPALAALGNNIIYYKYTNSFGCSDSISNTIKVVHCVECGPCFIEGPDLVVNGDFENGNTGFSSTLPLLTGCVFGSYAVVNTADQKCNHFNSIPDHTTGTGKYMVIDGDLSQPKDVWTENVNVTLGNTYKFSFWMHPELLGGASKPNIDIMINNLTITSIVGQNLPSQWTNFVVSWVSNVNGVIPITLHQSNTGGSGNDYGFDDIVFKVCIPILVVTWPISFADVCNDHQPFLLTGGMPSGGIYSGSGITDGYFDPSSVLPGIYILTYTYTDNNGCTNFTTNTITVHALPSVTWPVSFSPVCGNLSAFLLNGGLPSGGTYSGPGVDAFGNFNPSQVPFGTVTLTYTYTDGFGCTNTATNTINVINCIDCGACNTPGPNLFINGNFSNGNTGFFSALPVSCTCLVGSYCVTTDSYLKCNGFFHINDHTSGTGNFLVIDGSESSNVVVWQQNVAVAGSTTYTFSFWVHPQVSFINSNPILNIIINNVSQGLINTALLPKQWNNIVFSWTSTSPANIPVSIRQTNSEFSGMDYGLDDFSFNACIPNLNIDVGQDISICSGTSTQLTAVIQGAYTGVSWSPANGLSCTSCLNPVALPSVTTTYTLLVTTADGCTYSDQVTVTVLGCAVDLHLKTFIEGYYLDNGTMIAVVDPTNYPTLCDTIIVELHDASSPYGLVHSVKNTIDVNGNGQFIFPADVLTHSYYIVVRHRNSIETWSKTPVLFNGAVVSFDFTGQ